MAIDTLLLTLRVEIVEIILKVFGRISSKQIQEKEYDCFISYAHEDRDTVALPLANLLSNYGISVWIDKSEINLGKPHPFALLKCTEGLLSFRFAIYVGDSMEDAIMVERAKFNDQRYLFCGVYTYSIKEKKQISDFIERGADLIIPSVVELPTILSKIKRYKTIA